MKDRLLNNLEVAALFLLLNGPARAVTIQKAMYAMIKGKNPPKPFRWYSEYFRPCNSYYKGILASRYVVTTEDNHNAKTALWCRDEKTLMWTLTGLGKTIAYGATWTLEHDKHCRIKLPV